MKKFVKMFIVVLIILFFMLNYTVVFAAQLIKQDIVNATAITNTENTKKTNLLSLESLLEEDVIYPTAAFLIVICVALLYKKAGKRDEDDTDI